MSALERRLRRVMAVLVVLAGQYVTWALGVAHPVSLTNPVPDVLTVFVLTVVGWFLTWVGLLLWPWPRGKR